MVKYKHLEQYGLTYFTPQNMTLLPNLHVNLTLEQVKSPTEGSAP